MFNPFKLFLPKKMLGVDIGTSSVKLVEVSKWGGGKTLENYGEIRSESLYKDQDYENSFEKGSYLLSDYFVSRAIRAILDEAKITTNAAIFSVPDYSTFCTSFELPAMPEKEIAEAVRYHAPQYIPLPISETTLDWKIINNKPGDKKSEIKVFLVSIPNQVVAGYQRVAAMAGLELYALEAEVFALCRSLIKDNKKTICLIDIGVQSTTINIVDNGTLVKSYSFGFAGGQLTRAVSSVLSLNIAESEKIKNNQGLISSKEEVVKTLYLLIDPLITEIKKVNLDFYQREEREIQEIYLTGGTANLPGLKEYFSEVFNKKIEIPNCFSDILYPPILQDTLKKMGPSFSVALGLSLGGLEN